MKGEERKEKRERRGRGGKKPVHRGLEFLESLAISKILTRVKPGIPGLVSSV